MVPPEFATKYADQILTDEQRSGEYGTSKFSSIRVGKLNFLCFWDADYFDAFNYATFKFKRHAWVLPEATNRAFRVQFFREKIEEFEAEKLAKTLAKGGLPF